MSRTDDDGVPMLVLALMILACIMGYIIRGGLRADEIENCRDRCIVSQAEGSGAEADPDLCALSCYQELRDSISDFRTNY